MLVTDPQINYAGALVGDSTTTPQSQSRTDHAELIPFVDGFQVVTPG